MSNILFRMAAESQRARERRELEERVSYLNFYILFRIRCAAQHLYEKKEGSGAGSVPLANGSGAGRPKNIRIRFRIRTGILYIIDILLSVYACVRIRTSDEWIRTREAHKHADPGSGSGCPTLVFSISVNACVR
jgi:hypothetical protein